MCRTLEFATATVADRFLAGRVTLGPPWSVLPGPIPSMRAVRMIAGVRCRAPFHLLEWFWPPTRGIVYGHSEDSCAATCRVDGSC